MERAEVDALLETVDEMIREEYFHGIVAFAELLTLCLVQSGALHAKSFDLWLTDALTTFRDQGSPGAKLLLRVREVARAGAGGRLPAVPVRKSLKVLHELSAANRALAPRGRRKAPRKRP